MSVGSSSSNSSTFSFFFSPTRQRHNRSTTFGLLLLLLRLLNTRGINASGEQQQQTAVRDGDISWPVCVCVLIARQLERESLMQSGSRLFNGRRRRRERERGERKRRRHSSHTLINYLDTFYSFSFHPVAQLFFSFFSFSTRPT